MVVAARQHSALSEFSERDELIERYYQFVQTLVVRLMHEMRLPLHYRDDFIAAGLLGLVEAAGRFDSGRGTDFKSYAFLRIRGAVVDHIRSVCHLTGHAYRTLKALECANELRERTLQGYSESSGQVDHQGARAQDAKERFERGVEFLSNAAVAFMMTQPGRADKHEKELGVNPETEVYKLELSQRISTALATLPEKERIIIEQYYFHDLTLQQVADKYSGLSKSWVSRLHERALQMLREKLEAQGIKSSF